ncbi:baculoviral IAP repeat-containing protein 5-like [Temnothorax americanus]|uniref:baculoviral IAP repeat-containing protein 5-like n=1 Tax=Temnothorax americanus TaxID=1964332 RepID=UPI0040679740
MIIAEIPNTTSYFWKRNRSATYGSWPFKDSDKCNAERMADAGFYVVGDSNEPDLVECFMCGGQFSGWKPDDDPWRKHTKEYPLICPFVRFNKPDENKWSIKELCSLCKEYDIKVDMDNVRESLAKVRADTERIMHEQSIDRILNQDKYRKRPYRIINV